MYSLANLKVLRNLQLLKVVERLYGQNINLGKHSVEKLEERGLLRVHGKEASIFLQGLVTNDMRHLEEGAQSMYTMFLNIRGRVMCDTIIYKDEEDTFLVEGDKEALSSLQKHLKMYRVRKKIDIDLVDNINVWVIYDRTHLIQNNDVPNSHDAEKLQNTVECNLNNLDCISQTFQHSKIISRDPRLAELGYRLLVPSEENLLKDSESVRKPLNDSYKRLRYKLGVGEGVHELPPGKCFPLELNCDFLHGVSFHKGCYIGQELTARVHHTGVVRKRLMPIFFNSEPKEPFALDAPIENALDKKTLGKLRGLDQTFGLGLLKVADALTAPALSMLNVTAFTKRPNWWPQEAPKERSLPDKGQVDTKSL